MARYTSLTEAYPPVQRTAETALRRAMLRAIRQAPQVSIPLPESIRMMTQRLAGDAPPSPDAPRRP